MEQLFHTTHLNRLSRKLKPRKRVLIRLLKIDRGCYCVTVESIRVTTSKWTPNTSSDDTILKIENKKNNDRSEPEKVC